MTITMLLFGVLPLLAFVIIDSFMGLRAGLVSAILLAIVETLYSLYEFGTLDMLSIATLALVCAFALMSLKARDPIYMKLQPVFLGVGFAAILLVMQMMGTPLLVVMAEKYQALIPVEYRQNLNHPLMKAMLARTSLILGFGFLAHAAAVLYAAYRLNKWWWLAIRGVGVYVMLVACILIAQSMG